MRRPATLASRLPTLTALFLIMLSVAAQAERPPGTSDMSRCSTRANTHKETVRDRGRDKRQTPERVAAAARSVPAGLQSLPSKCPSVAERWVPGIR